MPIYEYECLVCGIRFERFQHFDDPPPETCPRGHHRVRRVFSPPGIIFKGPGFYVTDNRKEERNEGSGEKEKKAEKKEEAAG